MGPQGKLSRMSGSQPFPPPPLRFFNRSKSPEVRATVRKRTVIIPSFKYDALIHRGKILKNAPSPNPAGDVLWRNMNAR
jgi:hypothetical protein